MGFNLSKIDTIEKSENGVWCDIYYEGMKSGISIKLLGPDSKKYKAQALQLSKHLQKQKDKKADVNIDEMEEKSNQLLASITVDWKFTDDETGEVLEHELPMDEDGNTIKFSVENAMTLYTNFSFIKDQVQEFVITKENYLKG